MSVEKASLSDVFVKMQVAEDKISCSPLKLNGKYV